MNVPATKSFMGGLIWIDQQDGVATKL